MIVYSGNINPYYKTERVTFKYFHSGFTVLVIKTNMKLLKIRSLRGNAHGSGYLSAVILLVAVLMATIIGAIVFFAFADGITGTTSEANNTKDTVIGYAVTVFAMMAIVPLIMVGGLMLRSLGFMGGGGGGV